jgi:hypothetical protein
MFIALNGLERQEGGLEEGGESRRAATAGGAA